MQFSATETELPKTVKPRIDVSPRSRVGPFTETELPKRVKLCSESELPKLTKSTTDNGPPQYEIPFTETDEPSKRTIPLATISPHMYVLPYTERTLPSREKPRMDSVDPQIVSSKTLRLLLNVAISTIEIVAPNRAASETESEVCIIVRRSCVIFSTSESFDLITKSGLPEPFCRFGT
jgi:hypothetical protein